MGPKLRMISSGSEDTYRIQVSSSHTCDNLIVRINQLSRILLGLFLRGHTQGGGLQGHARMLDSTANRLGSDSLSVCRSLANR